MKTTSCTIHFVADVLWRLLALVAALMFLNSTAQAGGDARSLAMGGARVAAARGLDAATANPAFLAFSEGTTVGLAGGTVDIQNNSLTLGHYNEVSGATLTTADKQRLLAEIPDEGFGLDAQVDFGAIGLQRGNFAFTTNAVGAGDGRLDKDFFDLVLFGNVPGESVDFSSTAGEAFGVAKASLSWGIPVADLAGGRLAAGATASYLHGIYEVHVEEARGALTTTMTDVSGEAYVSAVTAEGGAGYGLDLALAWQGPGGWSLGVSLQNALGHLDWNGTVERTEYRVTAAALSVQMDSFDDAIADQDSTYTVGGYGTDLPRRMRVGGAWDTGSLTLAADYVQGLEDRAGTSTEPGLQVGVEWRPLGFLYPRVGAAVGGGREIALAGGLGVRAGFWRLDVAALSRGGLGESAAKGVGLGASTRFVF
ncbi:hypothetical protein DRQ50_08245 [bacterium]|nr:MAG: hypothetical protein DRQ50_08245 [bacterium]